jgi:antitoxin component of RelBE/YafQ-DinJ toxin-antitoxin module
MKIASKTELPVSNEAPSNQSSRVTEGKQLSQTLKKVASLRDLPMELRKTEANKPLYLTRYE